MINGMILILILLIFPSFGLDGDVPQRPSYGVYISTYFARASSHVTFYRRHFELIKKYHVSLKKLCNKVFVIQNFMEI